MYHPWVKEKYSHYLIIVKYSQTLTGQQIDRSNPQVEFKLLN